MPVDAMCSSYSNMARLVRRAGNGGGAVSPRTRQGARKVAGPRARALGAAATRGAHQGDQQQEQGGSRLLISLIKSMIQPLHSR